MFRKIFVAVCAAAALSALTPDVSAGDWQKARAGIAAGFTSSSSNAKNVDAGSIGRYHFGFTAELPIAYGFAVQPSVYYQTKGTKLSDIGPDKLKLDARAAFLEVPVQVQWGPDLVAFRPYVFAEPFVGYGLHVKAEQTEPGVSAVQTKSFKKAGMSSWEYGLGLGAGIDIWKIQFSVKYYWNFGSLYSENGKMENIGQTVKDAFKDGRNFNGVTFTLAYMF